MTSRSPLSNTPRHPANRTAITLPNRRVDSPPQIGNSSVDFWVFDLDGTIIDIEPWYRRNILDRVGNRLGYRFSDRQVDTLWYGHGDGRERMLQSMGIDADRFWRVFHDEEEPLERAQASYLYADSEAISNSPEPVGLVTHCQEYLTEPVLRTLGISDWFDTVVCCTDETGWKPAAGPVERAMTEMDVDPTQLRGMLVGDDPHDTGAAWNAGLESIHVHRSNPITRGHCVLGDWRISSLWNLLDLP